MSGETLKLGVGFPKFSSELSAQVRELQSLLKKWGYNIVETGYFDWPTDAAVLHFQRAVGLRADAQVRYGIGQTWTALQGEPTTALHGTSFNSVFPYTVPFIDQFDTIHVPGAGQTACFTAATVMLKAVGVKQAGPNDVFQVITNETWTAGIPNQTIDADALKNGIAYIDTQLAASTPVMVGVSYGAGTHNEGITEHFVVIYEKTSGGDYHFHDPATNQPANGAGRTFTLDANGNLNASGIGSQGVIRLRYYMSQVRRNMP